VRCRRRGIVCAAVAALVALSALRAGVCLADTGAYGGLTVAVDEPLEGSGSYGYAAYRVTVSNRSKNAHRVRIRIPANSYSYGYNDTIDRITCTVDIEPGAISTFEMLQPPLPIQGNGAAVYIDGTRQKRDINLDVGSHMDYNQAELVLVSRSVGSVLKDKIDTAIEEDAAATPGTGGYGGYGGMGGYGYSGDEEYTLAREPRPLREWGTNWLGYTRYMAVMVAGSDIASMPAALSDALRAYVLTGGTLTIVYSSDEPPSLAGWSQQWSPSVMPPPDARRQWSADYGLGTIRMLRNDTANQWESKRWINELKQWKNAARSRAATRDTESANLGLPVVEGQVTPARGLLLVMLLFAIVIGPVNVVVLWLLKRRMLLLLTVPVIALVFSAAVTVYALVSEGITPQARTTALTLLDQRSRTAVTVGVSGYYAPLTPANGLWFDENTSVTPQVERNGYGYYGGGSAGRSRSLDVTHGQHLQNGWVAARVPAHFVLRKSGSRRERLDIATEPDGTLSVVNGLGSDIIRLILVDHDGRRWTSQDIRAGQSVTLTPAGPAATGADPNDTSSVAELIRRDDWAGPNTINSNPDEFLPPGSYYAKIADSTFLDPGLVNLKEHRTDCVVLGYFAEGG
jgi:hypothetical protein